MQTGVQLSVCVKGNWRTIAAAALQNRRRNKAPQMARTRLGFFFLCVSVSPLCFLLKRSVSPILLLASTIASHAGVARRIRPRCALEG